jgi:uncharacterized protein (TIGR00156 family)
VSAIAKLKDETAVTLKGTLLKHLNEDHYEFSDGTGVILLDIDDDLWKASILKQVIKCRLWERWIHIVINRPILKSLK